MRSQDMTLLYALCNDSMTGPLNSISIVKKFITQVLDQKPSLVFRHPEICNARVFQQALTIQRAWRIFETLVKESKHALIVIDRIDQALDEDSTKAEFDLLPRLIDLASRYSTIDVIASSLYAPREKLDSDSGGLITKIMIDTTLRPFQRIDR